METTNSELQNFSLNQLLVPAKDIVARSNQDGTVIVMRLDESSLFYKINGIAAQVWGAIGSATNPMTANQLVGELTKDYPQFSPQLQQDIPKFLSDLVSKKLLMEA